MLLAIFIVLEVNYNYAYYTGPAVCRLQFDPRTMVYNVNKSKYQQGSSWLLEVPKKTKGVVDRRLLLICLLMFNRAVVLG